MQSSPILFFEARLCKEFSSLVLVLFADIDFMINWLIIERIFDTKESQGFPISDENKLEGGFCLDPWYLLISFDI